MTSSYSKTFLFVRPHANENPAFKKKTPLWSGVFSGVKTGFFDARKLRICLVRRTKAKTEEKTSPFSKIFAYVRTCHKSLSVISI